MTTPYAEITKQLNEVQKMLRGIRIQVTLLALKDAKTKTASVVVLENQLAGQLAMHHRNNNFIDDILDQLECGVQISHHHHEIAQQTTVDFAARRSH